MLTIEQDWDELRTSTTFPVHRRCSEESSLDLFVQIDTMQREGLLALGTTKPDVPQFASVEVVVGRRVDGRWATSVSIKEPALRRLFVTMCDEIVSEARTSRTMHDAGEFLSSALRRWQRLLALGPHAVLSQTEQLGLLGELIILRRAIGRFGPSVALEGWHGPDDAPQDFTLPCGLVEVKSTQADASQLSISSLEQLDTQAQPLMLAHLRFVRSAGRSVGITLYSAVDELRQITLEHSMSSLRLEQQLRRAGYEDNDEYKLREFVVPRETWYLVGDSFPRLGRSTVPPTVVNASYGLRVGGLFEHAVPPEF